MKFFVQSICICASFVAATSYQHVVSLKPSEGLQSPSGPSSPLPCEATGITVSFDDLPAIYRAVDKLNHLARRASECVVAVDGLVCFDYTYETLSRSKGLQQSLERLLDPLQAETAQGYKSAGSDLHTACTLLLTRLSYINRVIFEKFQEKLSDTLALVSDLINEAKGLNPESLDADRIYGSPIFKRCQDALQEQLPYMLSTIRKHGNLFPGYSLKAEYRDWHLRWRILFEFLKDLLSMESRLGQSFANQLGRLDRNSGSMSERVLFFQFARTLRECQDKMNEHIGIKGKREINVLGDGIDGQGAEKRFKATLRPLQKRPGRESTLSGKSEMDI